MSQEKKIIQVSPDKPALLAQRLMHRLVRDGFIPRTAKKENVARYEACIEAMADEIHQDILDSTLGK